MKLAKEGDVVDGGSMTRMATEEFVLENAGGGPVETYTMATYPTDASTVDPDTIIFVEDAPAGDEWAISDGLIWRHVAGGSRNYFGPIPFPTTDLILRLEGESAIGADGVAINNWPDSSGQDHDADVLYTGSGPVIRRGVVNGKDAIEFDNTKGRFCTSDLGSVYDDSDAKEMCLVFKHTNFTNTAMIEHNNAGASSQTPWGLHNGQASNGRVELRGVFNSSTIPQTGAVDATDYHRLDFRYDATADIRAWQLDDGAEQIDNTAFAQAAVGYELFIGGRADLNYAGLFAFFCIWNRMLDSDERAAMRAYVETEYGIPA